MQRELAQFRRLACLGLPPQSAVPALLEALHELVPSSFNRFGFADANLQVSNGYCENPDCYQYLDYFFTEIDGKVDYWPSISECLRRGPGVGYYLPYQNRTYYNSAYFADIERPLRAHHQLDMTVGHGGRVFGNAVLSREKGSAFTERDSALLARAMPYFAHAMSAAEQQSEPPWESTEHRAVVLVADDGRIKYADAMGLRCLWMLSGDDIEHSSMLTKLSVYPQLTRELARRLLAIEHAHSAPAPTMTVNSRWGLFKLRAERLIASAGVPPLVRVLIEHLQPSALVLSNRLFVLGLTPRQQDICEQLLAGRSPAEIAALLEIQLSTVNEYIQALYRRLGVRSRGALIRLASRVAR